MEDTGFSIVTGGDRQEPTVALRGDLDYGTGHLLRREVLQTIGQGAVKITVDMRGVNFIDSSGVSAVVMSNLTARAAGATLRVAGAPYPVRRTLEVCGLGELLERFG